VNDNLKGKNNRKITYSCKIKLSTYRAIKIIFQQLYGNDLESLMEETTAS
jgi:hypothetical protein